MTVPYTWLYIQQAAVDLGTYLLGIDPETDFEVKLLLKIKSSLWLYLAGFIMAMMNVFIAIG